MTNAKSSNIIYGIFIVFTMIVIGIILAFKGTKERESSSVDYDNSLSVGGYAVKINNCIYFTDTNEIVFTFKYKAMVGSPTNSIPEIYSITYSLKDELNSKLTYKTQDNSDEEQLVTCTDFDKDLYYIKVNFISKEPDYYDQDTYDDFGDVVKGAFHEGKKYDSYVQIDVQDMLKMTKNEYKTYTTQAPVTATEESSAADKVIDPSRTFVITTTTTPMTTESSEPATTTSTASKNSHESTSKKKTNVAVKSNQDHNEQQIDKPYVYTTEPRRYEDNDYYTEPQQTQRQTERQTQRQTTATTTTAYVPPEIKGLRLESSYSNNDVRLNVGESTTLTAVISPSNAVGNIIWESNRTDIAEVDSSGRVTAKAKGKAIITARAEDNRAVSASCMITVE